MEDRVEDSAVKNAARKRLKMTDISMPADFDWVRARQECSILKVFKELENGVRNDVAIMQSLKPDSQVKYFVTAPARGRFSVVREGGDFPDSVDFVLANGAITAQDDQGKFVHRAGITLNPKGECKLKVDQSELDQWQFRRLALEQLFFGPRDS